MAKEKGAEERERELAILEAEKEAMAKELEAKNKQLAELLNADRPEEKPELSKADKALIAEGCEVYGIVPQFVLSANVRDGVAVIVTRGGAKVRYSRDMDKKEIVPLDAVRVDGIIRKKFKAITGTKSPKK